MYLLTYVRQAHHPTGPPEGAVGLLGATLVQPSPRSDGLILFDSLTWRLLLQGWTRPQRQQDCAELIRCLLERHDLPFLMPLGRLTGFGLVDLQLPRKDRDTIQECVRIWHLQ